MIEAGIFTSVEFYTIAVTMAVLIVGFIFTPSHREPAMTYIYAAKVDASPVLDADGKAIEIAVADDFALHVRRRCAPLPEGTTAYVNVDIVDDKLTITEKHTVENHAAPLIAYDLSVRIDCLKASRYHLRYEVPDSGLWAVSTVVVGEGFSDEVTLQL